MNKRLVVSGIAFAVFAGMIVLSNYLLQHFGLIRLPLIGWMAPAGTFCAAITWPARDVLSRASGPKWGPWTGLLAVLIGAGIAYVISPTLALASAMAYLASEGTDWIIFWMLGGQTREGTYYLMPVFFSTTVAAFVDSVVFLYVADIPWGQAGPGLLLVKFSVVICVTPIVWLLRDYVSIDS